MKMPLSFQVLLPLLLILGNKFCKVLPAVTAAPFSNIAPDDKSVLILSTTLNAVAVPSPWNTRDAATSLLLTPVVATPAQWLSMSTADFKTYRALILGDPYCARGTSALQAAENSVNVWGPAITSDNIILVGSDPEFHSSSQPGASTLTRNAISFAAFNKGETGLYISFSCYYWRPVVPSTRVKVLSYFGSFSLATAGGCFDDVKVVATHEALIGVTDRSLSNWQCSVHEVFTEYTNFRNGFKFTALAVANGVFEGVFQPPYILANGVIQMDSNCSRNTADTCAFHFLGFSPSSPPPTFSLGLGKTEKVISPVIIDSVTGRNVRVLNSNRGFLFGNLPAGPFTAGALPHQFYLKGDKVAEQVFNFPRTVAQFTNKCVKVHVTHAYLQGRLNLSPGDKNANYPEEKRCVIFRTAA